MRVAVTGATGVIGRHAIDAILQRGDQVIALTRDPDQARGKLGGRVDAQAWADPKHSPPPGDALEQADAVLHLLGEPIAQRWSDDAKREIRDSRVLATQHRWSRRSPRCPRTRDRGVLVSQSATGYYGPRGDEPLDETRRPGDDFLAEVVTAVGARSAGGRRPACGSR